MTIAALETSALPLLTFAQRLSTNPKPRMSTVLRTDHVINIRPRRDALARAWSERAWLRLNCPDQSYGNGRQALKDATAACKLMDWKDENMIDTFGDGVCRSRRLRLRGALRGESLSSQMREG
jgi:hypothetical protein